ncbi:glutaredoxin family protein [Cutibacterium sp. WCA-380-WT-3A]|uniref:Glutaredoxin family protein n=1 Tax=Cutibacterium porci TaxID=2605781 RepID=A0A7K0J4Z1_9ACTN|nr:glutaredoxin family protein [Cutibacterium porci]MSS45011.1 glutaredoxin family protein [Cutibacterium porci]
MWRHRHGATAPRSGESRPLDPPVEGRVVIITRQGCHLCDEAVSLVARMRRERRDLVPEPTIVDVDATEALRSRWGDHVPVTFVDGTLIAYWTLDADTFWSALNDGPSLPAVLP